MPLARGKHLLSALASRPGRCLVHRLAAKWADGGLAGSPARWPSGGPAGWSEAGGPAVVPRFDRFWGLDLITFGVWIRRANLGPLEPGSQHSRSEMEKLPPVVQESRTFGVRI